MSGLHSELYELVKKQDKKAIDAFLIERDIAITDANPDHEFWLSVPAQFSYQGNTKACDFLKSHYHQEAINHIALGAAAAGHMQTVFDMILKEDADINLAGYGALVSKNEELSNSLLTGLSTSDCSEIRKTTAAKADINDIAFYAFKIRNNVFAKSLFTREEPAAPTEVAKKAAILKYDYVAELLINEHGADQQKVCNAAGTGDNQALAKNLLGRGNLRGTPVKKAAKKMRRGAGMANIGISDPAKVVIIILNLAQSISTQKNHESAHNELKIYVPKYSINKTANGHSLPLPAVTMLAFTGDTQAALYLVENFGAKIDDFVFGLALGGKTKEAKKYIGHSRYPASHLAIACGAAYGANITESKILYPEKNGWLTIAKYAALSGTVKYKNILDLFELSTGHEVVSYWYAIKQPAEELESLIESSPNLESSIICGAAEGHKNNWVLSKLKSKINNQDLLLPLSHAAGRGCNIELINILITQNPSIESSIKLQSCLGATENSHKDFISYFIDQGINPLEIALAAGEVKNIEAFSFMQTHFSISITDLISKAHATDQSHLIKNLNEMTEIIQSSRIQVSARALINRANSGDKKLQALVDAFCDTPPDKYGDSNFSPSSTH